MSKWEYALLVRRRAARLDEAGWEITFHWPELSRPRSAAVMKSRCRATPSLPTTVRRYSSWSNVRWKYGPVVYLGLNVQGSNDNYPYAGVEGESRTQAQIAVQRAEEGTAIGAIFGVGECAYRFVETLVRPAVIARHHRPMRFHRIVAPRRCNLEI